MTTKKESENKQEQSQKEEKNQKGGESSKAIAGDTGADIDLNAELERLMQTLDGDLSEIENQDALDLINQWYDILHQSKEAGVKELANEMKALQKLVKGGKASGHEISEELIHLGEQVGDFSSNAEKGSKQLVQRLGKQLRQKGTEIAKAEDQEHLQQIDQLMEKVEGDELSSLEPGEAVAQIDVWYNLLHKQEGESYQQLANSLKELKQTLKKSSAKPEAIANILSQVGEQTTSVASELPRGFKGAVQKLGKHLTNTSKSLTTAE
jgi:hypothetical protein